MPPKSGSKDWNCRELKPIDFSEIHTILLSLGGHVPPASRLILVGGSALALLGSPRLTIDLDCIGDDVSPSELDQAILRAAKELKIPAKAIPLERFIPLPEGSEARTISIGQFRNLEVLIADPFSIALSKLDRGFDTDLDDLVFLIQHKFVILAKLERITHNALSIAGKFDMHPEILVHLQELKKRLKREES